MRLPLPGPAAVIGGAAAAAGTVQTALGLLPRAADALSRVEVLLDRVEVVVDRAEKTTDRSAAMLGTAELVTRDASRTVDGAKGVLDRTDLALQAWEPSLRKLAPSMERFAESLHPDEVTAAIGLIDRMPQLLDHVENDVLPALQSLDRVGPDLHEVLEIVEDLRRVITGLPGIGLLRKRGENEPPPVEGSVHETGVGCPTSVVTTPSLRLRALNADDEARFVAAHKAVAPDGFTFGLGYQPGMPWLPYVESLERQRHGRDLPDGFVPSTFLVADVGGVIVGRASVRHELNDHLAREGGHIGYAVLPEYRRRGYATEMLRQSLDVARDHGIERVLVTCDDNNVGSIAVIERCGGVLDDALPLVPVPGAQPKRRYWIDA